MKQEMSELEPLFYDVRTFCDAARISRSTFYALQRDGRGPQMTKINNRSLIAPKEAQRWQVKMLMETMEKTETA